MPGDRIDEPTWLNQLPEKPSLIGLELAGTGPTSELHLVPVINYVVKPPGFGRKDLGADAFRQCHVDDFGYSIGVIGRDSYESVIWSNY